MLPKIYNTQVESLNNRGDSVPKLDVFCQHVKPSVTSSLVNEQRGLMEMPEYLGYKRIYRSFFDCLNFTHCSNVLHMDLLPSWLCFYLTINLFSNYFGYSVIYQFVVLHKISSRWLLKTRQHSIILSVMVAVMRTMNDHRWLEWAEKGTHVTAMLWGMEGDICAAGQWRYQSVQMQEGQWDIRLRKYKLYYLVK